MNVHISFTITIDPQAWSEQYGTESSDEVRRDVKRHVENMTVNQLSDLGVLA